MASGPEMVGNGAVLLSRGLGLGLDCWGDGAGLLLRCGVDKEAGSCRRGHTSPCIPRSNWPFKVGDDGNGLSGHSNWWSWSGIYLAASHLTFDGDIGGEGARFFFLGESTGGIKAGRGVLYNDMFTRSFRMLRFTRQKHIQNIMAPKTGDGGRVGGSWFLKRSGANLSMVVRSRSSKGMIPLGAKSRPLTFGAGLSRSCMI